MSERQKAFEAWLDEACGAVPRRARAAVRDELQDHLAALEEALLAEGTPENDLTEQALTQMGDPAELGASLGRIHRTNIPWGVWLAGLGLTALGFAVFAADTNGTSPFASAHLTWSVLGLAIGLACVWLKPRHVVSIAPWLHGASLAGIIGVGLWGARSQGQAFLDLGVLKINLLAVSPLLFIAAFAGLFSRRSWHRPSEPWGALGLELLPSVLLTALSFPAAGLSTLIAGGAIVLALNPRPALRLPLAVGFGVSALALLISASIGGLLAPLALQPAHTVAHTDGIFARAVAALGWGAGAGLVILGVAFAIAALRWSVRVAHPLARAGWVGLVALFGVEFLWNLLAIQGLVVAPHGGIALPFVSYGGSHTVLQFALLGVVTAATVRRPGMVMPS